PWPTGIPAPAIAAPDGGQHVEGGGGRSGVLDVDLPQDFLRARLGPRHSDDEVTAGVEDPSVDELVLGLSTAAPGVLRTQVVVGELRLRVVVTPLQPARGRRSVQVPPTFLHVFAVVPLGAGETVHP